jgi:GlpG protein
MRAIGTVANEQDARRLGAHLLARGIASQMDPARDGYQVWIRDEDKLQQAQRELAIFLQNPVDPRYDAAEKLAQQVRAQQAAAEKQYQRNVRDIRSQWSRPNLKSCPLTIGLIVVCLVVAALTRMGEQHEPVLNVLLMTPVLEEDGRQFIRLGLPEIRDGQVWRLITPIFLHFGFPHLLFNLWNLYNIGAVIEIRRGIWQLLALVLVTAIVSNVAQCLWKDPVFGGMSGVLYGLFGYAWMKSRYDPSVGIFLPRDVVVLMIAWLFLCMTGRVGPIANAAHVGGFIVGIAIGIAPYLWRKIFRS